MRTFFYPSYLIFLVKRFLIVCNGNIYRSVIGEAILKKELGKKAKVKSAGVLALDGFPASPLAVVALKEVEGLDVLMHKSRLVTKELVDWATDIIVMEDSQKEFILKNWKHAKAKIHPVLNVEDVGINFFYYEEYVDTVKEIRKKLRPFLK